MFWRKLSCYNNLYSKYITIYIINSWFYFLYCIFSDIKQMSDHLSWIVLGNKRYRDFFCWYLIFPSSVCFIKAGISIDFIKIVYRKIIAWAFVLYEIICTENPAYIFVNLFAFFFLNDKDIYQHGFRTERIFILGHQFISFLLKFNLQIRIKRRVPLKYIFSVLFHESSFFVIQEISAPPEIPVCLVDNKA